MNLSPSLRPRRALGAVAVLVTACIGLPAAPASAGFGIALRPAHADPNDPATRAYFKPSAAPGESFSDQVIVTNTGDAPIELAVSGVDGLTAPTSGAVYGNRQDPVTKAGAWVGAASTAVTVPAHSELPVPFTVKVPKDAAAGDHLAGIAFEDVHPTSAGSNFAVTQVVRAVMGVQIIVPGPGAFAVHVDGAALKALPGVAAGSVVVTLGNNGARLGKPALSVVLTGPNGYQRKVDRTLDTILPGDTIAYPLAWPDVLPPGDYTISASASASASATATAPGAPAGAAPAVHTASAHLGTALAGVPAPGVVTPAPLPARHSGGSYPLMWAALVLVAAAGVGAGLYFGGRGRRRGGKAPAPEPALAPEPASQYSDR